MLMPSGLRIIVTLPMPNRKKNGSGGKSNTCRHQGRCPAGHWHIQSCCLGKSEFEDVDLKIVTLCGSDAMKMCLITYRVWGERTGQ